MDLIWDKNNFSADFKHYIGIVDADIKFNRMESSLIPASSEIYDLIGDTNYSNVLTDADEAPFTKLVKRAILIRALIIYLPTADIAITNNGRKNRVDEHEGTPWEWMLDKNETALTNFYYMHLDLLLKHMFRNNIPVNTEKYDFKNLLVNSLDLFEKHFNINGSHFLFLKLIPALLECEELELSPRLGGITSDAFSTAMKNTAEKACVYYALDWGLRRLNVQLFPDGVFQQTINTGGKMKKAGAGLQYLETAMLFKADCQKYLISLEQMVSKAQNAVLPHHDRIVIDSGICFNDGFIDT